MSNPVNWFEIPATDLTRAKTFYEKSFATQLHEMDMGPTKMAMFHGDEKNSGASGSLVQGETYTPSHDGSLVYFPVKDIDTQLAKINDHGGKTLVPKFSIGEHGSIALFEDSEGNRVGLHQAP